MDNLKLLSISDATTVLGYCVIICYAVETTRFFLLSYHSSGKESNSKEFIYYLFTP